MNKKFDLTNQRFGKLTALYISGRSKNKTLIWHCVCDCGNETDVFSTNLRSGKTTSCGCFQKEKVSKDITGEKFGYLTVLNQEGRTKERKIKWKCQCNCGNIIIVDGDKLRNGNTKSCGCLQKERASQSKLIDLTNRRFGNLKVIKRSGSTNDGHALWLCKCDCGSFKEISGKSLISGHTKSCGCVKSFGEKEIISILEKHNISYQKEFIFSELRSEKNKPLRFDFAIFNGDNLLFLIEYQGEQHYNKKSRYYSNTLVKHDEMKIDFCKNKDIKLLILDKNSNLEKDILDNMKG